MTCRASSCWCSEAARRSRRWRARSAGTRSITAPAWAQATAGSASSLSCQASMVGIWVVSYNMRRGERGLLSFGHALYYGLGALFTFHALNFSAAGWHLPVTLMPLVGAIAGLAFGIVLGYITTRRAGTTFAMISLGVGEMVAACSLMLPGV